jgi:hypothetical protein
MDIPVKSTGIDSLLRSTESVDDMTDGFGAEGDGEGVGGIWTIEEL